MNRVVRERWCVFREGWHGAVWGDGLVLPLVAFLAVLSK